MWEMFRTIQKNSDIGLENLISDKCLILDRTRIPLLILYFKNGYKVNILVPNDINFHAIRNTNLMRHYVMASYSVSIYAFFYHLKFLSVYITF